VFLRLICLFVCFQGTWRPDEQRRPGVRRSPQREARRGGSSSDCCSIFSALVYLLGPIRFVLEPWTSGGRQTSSDGLARRVGPDGRRAAAVGLLGRTDGVAWRAAAGLAWTAGVAIFLFFISVSRGG